MLKAVAAALALLLVMGPMLASAQYDTGVDVPAGGYVSTDTVTTDLPDRFYYIHVPEGLELVYDFSVVGNGSITVFLSPKTDPLNYYVEFSTTDDVTEFSRTFPADFGFARDYYIQVNSTFAGDVQYEVDIHTQEAPTGNYNLYYVLIVLGFVALVVFSWKFVVWQEKRERKEKGAERRKRR